jgi:hypothetical protein
VDASTAPEAVALRLADWLESADRHGSCRLHDVMAGDVIPW